jgi:hypothetical protein
VVGALEMIGVDAQNTEGHVPEGVEASAGNVAAAVNDPETWRHLVMYALSKHVSRGRADTTPGQLFFGQLTDAVLEVAMKEVKFLAVGYATRAFALSYAMARGFMESLEAAARVAVFRHFEAGYPVEPTEPVLSAACLPLRAVLAGPPGLAAHFKSGEDQGVRVPRISRAKWSKGYLCPS